MVGAGRDCGEEDLPDLLHKAQVKAKSLARLPVHARRLRHDRAYGAL